MAVTSPVDACSVNLTWFHPHDNLHELKSRPWTFLAYSSFVASFLCWISTISRVAMSECVIEADAVFYRCMVFGEFARGCLSSDPSFVEALLEDLRRDVFGVELTEVQAIGNSVRHCTIRCTIVF